MSPGETLLVDIGNSRIKWARVGGHGLLEPGEALHTGSTTHALRSMVDAQPGRISRLVATNVGGESLGSALKGVATDTWGVDPEIVLPEREAYGVRCAYDDPTRLGADRWVAMIGAHRAARGGACVIDAGTTVTLDAVDAEGQHLGGLILAGPRMLYAALHRETSDIGETSGSTSVPAGIELLATSTDQAVANGAMLGLAGALDRALAVVTDEAEQRPAIYITGGDARVLSAWLETETQYRANLVLEGLAFIATEGR